MNITTLRRRRENWPLYSSLDDSQKRRFAILNPLGGVREGVRGLMRERGEGGFGRDEERGFERGFGREGRRFGRGDDRGSGRGEERGFDYGPRPFRFRGPANEERF